MKETIFISLGNNCEIGFQFKRIGYDKSSFFRFASCKFPSLIKILENNFKDIYKFENLIPVTNTMVRDIKYNIAFHSQMTSKVINEKRLFTMNERERKKIYDFELSKIKYLLKKQDEQFTSDQKKFFFLKTDLPLSCSQLDRLCINLKLLGSKNFYIVYLTLDEWKIESNNENIKIEKLLFFSLGNETDKGDNKSYNEIFRKYGTQLVK